MSAALADPPSSCGSASPESLDRLSGMAREWDYMNDTMLAAAGPRDHRTRFGTVLDESCFAGVSASTRARRIERLELGLGTAMAQMRGCGQALGFAESDDVIAVLRRTRVSCHSLGASGMGEMTTEFPCSDPRHRGITATATRRFEMTLAVPNNKDGAPMPGLDFADWSTPTLASILAHEAMHVLAMNNRAWHNSLRGRDKGGCANSMFADRVYFTESACFPGARSSERFYQDAYQCEELCLSALTEVDPEVAADGRDVLGPTTVARPYPLAEARRICQRIREHRGVFPVPGL